MSKLPVGDKAPSFKGESTQDRFYSAISPAKRMWCWHFIMLFLPLSEWNATGARRIVEAYTKTTQSERLPPIFSQKEVKNDETC